MIRTLVRDHPLMRPIYFKWLILAIAVASMWTATITMQLRHGPLAHAWLMLTVVWLPPALYLLFGPQTRRARQFPLLLPIPSRSLWTAHLIAVGIVSGAMVVACIGFEALAIRLLAGQVGLAADDLVALLPRLWSHGLAWWLALVALSVSDRTGLLEIPRTGRWHLRQSLAGIVAYVALIVSGRHTLVVAGVVAAVAAIALVRAQHRVPAAMSLAPRRPLAAPAPRRNTFRGGALAPWRRTPLWLTILMASSKFPAMLLVAAPFLVITGIALASYSPGNMADGNLGVLYVAITAYCVFAVSATPLSRLSLFDHLPIPRQRLFVSLVMPAILLIGAGYAAGRVLAARQGPGDREPLTFRVDAEGYGLRMEPRYFSVAWGAPPSVTAPDGTVVTPPDDWRPLGPRGPVLYKPFHTPDGASLALCAWQLERASAHIFGRAIPAAEFTSRYLATDPLDRRVILRDGEMALLHDHPDLVPRRPDASPALVLLFVVGLFQLAFAAYLQCFRPNVTERTRKTVFFGILVGFLTLHLIPYALAIAGVVDTVETTAIIRAASALLEANLPGESIGMWVLVAALLAAGHNLVLHGFRRAEWPPVREDDAMYDVLG